MPFDTKKLSLYPQKSGVYLMKDAKGAVLYVGKAKNLRERIKQYFSFQQDSRAQVPFLIKKVESIETVVVHSEKEAFLLENTLIKRYQPKYNLLLKDDKTYLSLKINYKDKWPMIKLARLKGKPNRDELHFGPYVSMQAARQTLNLINRFFPLRQCSDREFVQRNRPCILYDMHRCIAPCVSYCKKKEYDEHVKRVVRFLQGKDKQVVRSLRKEMGKLSENLEFEKAARTLHIIGQIEKTLECQKVDLVGLVDMDVLSIFRRFDEAVLVKMIFRSGKLIGSANHYFSKVFQEDAEIFEFFLMQRYVFSRQSFPREILLPISLKTVKLLEEIISSHCSHKVRICCPLKGKKMKFIKMAEENAKAAFYQEKDLKAAQEKILLEMQERFFLSDYPRRIECFDTSHMSGSEKVASMVVFIDGEVDLNRCRKYKIKDVKEGDDYAMMREVIARRYEKAKERGDFPELVIVDGGKGQLNIARTVLSELNIVSVDVIALAKEKGRHDKGLSLEKVFLPDRRDPVSLERDSSLLFFLQRVRDEAHRVSITFHRKRQRKKSLHSFLDDVPGIGPVKRKALLSYFGSAHKIKEASVEELSKVKGISRSNAQVIFESLKS